HLTARRVAERLGHYGYEVATGVGKTGVVGLLRDTKRASAAGLEAAPSDAGVQRPLRTLLYRADMDALPIREENDVEYRSQNAVVMHACGHDAHVAIALAVAKVISSEHE